MENEQLGINPWGISFIRMFDMSNDSVLFKSEAGNGLVPLYEAKMFHQFDHRYSTYEGATQANLNAGILPQLSEEIKQKPDLTVQSRYWVNVTEVENKLGNKWNKNWLLSFRDVSNAISERTSIFSLIPKVAIGNNAPVILTEIDRPRLVSCLSANSCSLIFDFVTRHKVGGNHMNFFIVKQLPVIPPATYTSEDIEIYQQPCSRTRLYRLG